MSRGSGEVTTLACVSELLAALIGIVAGAIATGAVQTWHRSRDRKLASKVAARLILGDLYLAEHNVVRLLEAGKWPEQNMPTFERELETWETNRQALAAEVDATDWTRVATAYHDLIDLPGFAKAGQVLTGAELHTLGAVRKRLDQAGELVAEHAVPKRERARVMEEITRDNAAAKAERDASSG